MQKHNLVYSDQESESSSQDSAYQQKLKEYKQLAKHKQNLQVPQDSSDEDSAALKPRLPQTTSTHPYPKSPLTKTLSAPKTLKFKPCYPTMPRTTTTTTKLTRKKPSNDPVSRYQQLAQTWRKDKFLSGGANKKQGRKLELEKRNKWYGVL